MIQIKNIDINNLSAEKKKELAKLLEIKEIREAKADYCKYVEYVHRGYWKRAKHLEYLCQVVQDFIEHKTDKQILLLSLPPQHGKSNTITETLPSYFLGRFPDKRVIAVSYGDDLASRFGKRNREKIIEFGKKIFDIELSPSSKSITEFDINNHKGSMSSRGIMAGITGLPADIIIVDDPIKNRQEAESETYRNKVWDEWMSSVITRLSAKGKVIVIQTRWHEDDLIGRILKHNKDDSLYINITCEAEEGDILGRKVGDALFPEIGKDNEWLKKFKNNYCTEEGSRTWLSLFQGKPTSAEGNMLKREWWKKYIKLPKMALKIISVDATFKDSKKSDFVAIQVWGKVGDDMFLIDRLKKRMDFVDTVKAIKAMNSKHTNINSVYVEDKANGSAIISTLRSSIPYIIPVTPKESKEARVSAISPCIEAGHVYLPSFEIAPWIEEFIDECCKFPKGVHDDEVDAMSQAILKLKNVYADLISDEDIDDEDYMSYEDQIAEMCKCT